MSNDGDRRERMRAPALRRRDFIALLGNVTLGWPLVASGQPARKIPRIGVLWHAANEEEEAVYLAALRLGLRDFGYIEGQNIILENRFPAEQPERFARLAVELAELKVDVLVAITRIAALAAQRATKTIPIVFVAVPNPVESKLVASMARPGGNVTGLSNMALDLTAKRLEFLKATVPGMRRPALLVNGNDQDGSRQYIEECQSAADRLKLTLQPVEIRTPGDLAPAFSKMSNDQVDGVVVTQDGLFFATRKAIADLALARRLPLIVYSRETVEVGALVSYGPSNMGIFRRTGFYVDKILKGTVPSVLPVEQPTRFEFIVNLKVAKMLGIEVPPPLLAQANEVIE
jgi:putative ABC transport system substrate-binding protein